MLVGIIILILGLALIIIDGLSTPKWRLVGTIWSWLNNRIVRRLLQVLLGLGITVGSLFILSTCGFLFKNNWLTVIPVAVAMVVIWIALISGAALEGIVRAWTRLLGFGGISDQATLEKWEKGFMSVFFWIYLMLALYPVYNPWTGNPSMVIFIAMFGLALATYARWAAGPGKKPKIVGLIIVPLLFLYCLGKQQPNVYPTLGSLVKWIESTSGLTNAKRDLGSAVKDQQSGFYRDGEEIIKKNTYALLKSDVAALDADLNQIELEQGYKEEVKILQKLAAPELPPKLKARFEGSTESFYKIQFMDDLGKYSIKSQIGYIETSGVKGIINIPEAPEINNPNKNPENTPILTVPLPGGGYKKIITLSSKKWSEKILLPRDVDIIFAGHPDALVKFEDTGVVGSITGIYGTVKGPLRFKGPDYEKAVVKIIPK